MADQPPIDPRLQQAAEKPFVPNKRECQTVLYDLATMFATPVPNDQPVNMKARNVTLKALFPQTLKDEARIDYERDNATMGGRSSTDEWAAYAKGQVDVLKKHPQVILTLQTNGFGPELPPEILQEGIEAGRRIYDNLRQMRRFDEKITNPRVEVVEPKGRGGRH